jgi:hypothetical protein
LKFRLDAARLDKSNQPGDRLMDELVPVILGAASGVIIWLGNSGRKRFLLSVLAVAVSGIIATIASGEYLESWIYLLLDFGEAAFGLVAGVVVAARLLTSRSAVRRGANAP